MLIKYKRHCYLFCQNQANKNSNFYVHEIATQRKLRIRFRKTETIKYQNPPYGNNVRGIVFTFWKAVGGRTSW